MVANPGTTPLHSILIGEPTNTTSIDMQELGNTLGNNLGQCLCLSCIPQRKTTANRKGEFAVAYIIGKFAYFGWIRLCQHACNLYGRVQLCRTLGQKRRISKSSSRLQFRK